MIRTTGKTTQAFLLTVAALAICICGSGCNQTAGVVMNRSGMGYYKMGHYANAAHEFRQALVSEPNNADYAANLAMSLQKSGDTAGAEKMYRRALAANPGHQTTYREYSRMLANQNRTPEALALMQQYVGTQGYQAEPHIQLAQLHRELGNRTGEVHALQQALEISPQHPVALASMGEYFQDQGQTKTAMTMYERSLRSNNMQPEVQSRYAALQGQVQRDQKSKATLVRLHHEHQRTAQAIQSMQHQSRLAAAPQRPTVQMVQVPQRSYVQSPMVQQAMQPVHVAQRPYQNGVVSDVDGTLPQAYDSSQVISSFPSSSTMTQQVGPFLSESQPAYTEQYSPGQYEVGSTVALPTDVKSQSPALPSITAANDGTTVVGPEVSVPPTRISTGVTRSVNPQTAVPSRRRLHDHSHNHETHSPAVGGPARSQDSVPETGTSAPDFDEDDILGDVGVWDPVKSTADPAHASEVSVESF